MKMTEKEEFKCNECGNTSFTYVDFTAKSVRECEQCKTKYYEEDTLEENEKIVSGESFMESKGE